MKEVIDGHAGDLRRPHRGEDARPSLRHRAMGGLGRDRVRPGRKSLEAEVKPSSPPLHSGCGFVPRVAAVSSTMSALLPPRIRDVPTTTVSPSDIVNVVSMSVAPPGDGRTCSSVCRSRFRCRPDADEMSRRRRRFCAASARRIWFSRALCAADNRSRSALIAASRSAIAARRSEFPSGSLISNLTWSDEVPPGRDRA